MKTTLARLSARLFNEEYDDALHTNLWAEDWAVATPESEVELLSEYDPRCRDLNSIAVGDWAMYLNDADGDAAEALRLLRQELDT